MNMMELYVCPDCRLLLLRVDKKYSQWEDAYLTTKGIFIGTYNGEMNDDIELESFHCRLCTCNSKETDEAKRLRSVELPEDCLDDLIELRYKLAKKASDSEAPDDDLIEALEHGIPIDSHELKEIITVSLL